MVYVLRRVNLEKKAKKETDSKPSKNRSVRKVLSNIRKRRMEIKDKTETKIMDKWQRYEKRKAKAHRGRHVGGSGKPDYTRGNTKGEVKCQKRPITKTQVKAVAQKGITEISSKSGFTQPAIDYVKRYRPNMKLFQRGKRRN